jgi:hypothetical protein
LKIIRRIISYLHIKAAKSFFNVPREKLSPRPLAAEAAISRMLKDFATNDVYFNGRR